MFVQTKAKHAKPTTYERMIIEILYRQIPKHEDFNNEEYDNSSSLNYMILKSSYRRMYSTAEICTLSAIKKNYITIKHIIK